MHAPYPPPLNATHPIGIFDSGVGGLTVARAIRSELPAERLLYVADSAFAPYGDKPPELIAARALAISQWLRAHGAKAIVVACNTATGVAAEALRTRFALPIVALEPAVKPAVALTASGTIGVLATRRTLDSARFAALVERVGQGRRILRQPCPGLVECVEHGDLNGARVRTLLTGYLQPLLAAGADTLVLGCTHYPFLAPLIAELAGPDIHILDSGTAVARELHRRLALAKLLAANASPDMAPLTCRTSGEPDAQRTLIARLWAAPFELEHLAPTHNRNERCYDNQVDAATTPTASA